MAHNHLQIPIAIFLLLVLTTPHPTTSIPTLPNLFHKFTIYPNPANPHSSLRQGTIRADEVSPSTSALSADALATPIEEDLEDAELGTSSAPEAVVDDKVAEGTVMPSVTPGVERARRPRRSSEPRVRASRRPRGSASESPSVSPKEEGGDTVDKVNLSAGLNETMTEVVGGNDAQQVLEQEEESDARARKKEKEMKKKPVSAFVKKRNDRQDAMSEINAFRRKAGRNDLIIDTPLMREAQKQAKSMATSGEVFHRAADKLFDVKYRLRATKIGENVGHQLYTPDQNLGFEIAESWKMSPPHRATMLDRAYTHAGFNCHVGVYGTSRGPFCALVVTRYKPTLRLSADGGKVITIDPVIV